jgi:hypothetical protein
MTGRKELGSSLDVERFGARTTKGVGDPDRSSIPEQSDVLRGIEND